MGGDLADARSFLRRECYPHNEGLCVTIIPTAFIFTGGAEDGVAVQFVNYPRFPTEQDYLYQRAKNIAMRMMTALCQTSCLLVTSEVTEWLSLRLEDNQPEGDL